MLFFWNLLSETLFYAKFLYAKLIIRKINTMNLNGLIFIYKNNL